MLAIAILAVICGTIYQFTGTVIRSSNISLRTDAQAQSLDGLRRLLGEQFSALPANETGVFFGVSEAGKHGHRDALQVVCPAGNALLTPDARGLYRVTLGLDERPAGSGHYTLVMEREPRAEDEDDDENNGSAFQLPTVSAGGVQTNRNQLPADRVRLLGGVSSLEISYYDPRLNTWQDKWRDDTLIPSLVRVRLALENGGAPYEFVEQIPGGGLRRGLPNTVSVPNNGASASLGNGVAGTVSGAAGPSGATVPSLPPGLTVPPPPPGGFTVPSAPPGQSGASIGNHGAVSFPNAPIRGGVPR